MPLHHLHTPHHEPPHPLAHRLSVHMATNPGTSEAVYKSQMLRPLCEAIDAALARHEEEAEHRAKLKRLK
jgi:hypothetical protein